MSRLIRRVRIGAVMRKSCGRLRRRSYTVWPNVRSAKRVSIAIKSTHVDPHTRPCKLLSSKMAVDTLAPPHSRRSRTHRKNTSKKKKIMIKNYPELPLHHDFAEHPSEKKKRSRPGIRARHGDGSVGEPREYGTPHRPGQKGLAMSATPDRTSTVRSVNAQMGNVGITRLCGCGAQRPSCPRTRFGP